MLLIDYRLNACDLVPAIQSMWELSAEKIARLENRWKADEGAPVFTAEGRYTSRAWTDWTRGFQYGSALLQYDATGAAEFLTSGRDRTLAYMANHLTDFGVHDHGFNIVSTYGNLWRLSLEGRIDPDSAYELALRCSGAVQARRWTSLGDGAGYIHSFNGPHSLFADTIRSLRSLALAHMLGQHLSLENGVKVSLLSRLIQHAVSTAQYSTYYGEGRDIYDVRGRVAHESIFNVTDGKYRCPSTQQGYAPFTTWTRGLAWVICGFAEELEFLRHVQEAEAEEESDAVGGAVELFLRAARASADFYIQNTPSDGIPYWDTGAPGLSQLPACLETPADPFNNYEPVDSSAAAIAAQGLLRLGVYLRQRGEPDAEQYWQAGLTVSRRLLQEPYLSVDPAHEGLLLHSVYHRPNGWDYLPTGSSVPRGESCMWGDYHLRELAVYVQRVCDGGPYLTFFGPEKNA